MKSIWIYLLGSHSLKDPNMHDEMSEDTDATEERSSMCDED